MSNYYQTYYTTGEFAKLCHTTKETLFHYDEIGLLKPALMKDNGYRYYLSKQYFEFDLIKVLQETHMSLKEIKHFMKQRHQESVLQLLESKHHQLEEEKQKIEHMQLRIEQSIQHIEYGMKTYHGIPFIEQCDEQHLLAIQLPQQTMSDKDMFKYMSDHLLYCQQHHLTEELPLGTIIYQDYVLKRQYVENEYYVVIHDAIDDYHYVEKPQGRYATILHEGFYDTIEISYQKLLQYIEDNHYEIISHAYTYEIHNHFSVQEQQQYVISISIRIK